MSLLTAWRAYRRRTGLAREATTFALGLIAGLVLLPAAIYAVGRLVFGPYTRSPGDATPHGPLAFGADFLSGLAHGSLAHWLVVAGPYGAYLIYRLGRRVLRA